MPQSKSECAFCANAAESAVQIPVCGRHEARAERVLKQMKDGTYSEVWDLSTIPDPIFKSEYGRRRGQHRKGYRLTCECGQCSTCIKREKMRKFREKDKKV